MCGGGGGAATDGGRCAGQGGGRKDRKRKKLEPAAAEAPALERFEGEELQAAQLLLEEETSIVRHVPPSPPLILGHPSSPLIPSCMHAASTTALPVRLPCSQSVKVCGWVELWQ